MIQQNLHPIQKYKDSDTDGVKQFGIESYHIFTEQHIWDTVLLNQPFYSEYFAIMLIQQGEVNLSCNLAEYTLHKNSLFFIAPKLSYEIKSVNPDSHLVGIAFDSEFMSQNGLHLTSLDVLGTFSSGISPHYALKEEDVYILQSLFNVIQKKTGLDHSHVLDKETSLHTVLAIIYEAATIYNRRHTVGQVKLTRKEVITLNFLQQLSEHYKEERSVQYYAGSLFVTSRHLSQVIKEITGKTAGGLIDDAVIMQAKILLANPSFNVSQVAEFLQFSDQSFFGKFFKKHMGISPSEYRINRRLFRNPPF
jgi:AraC family transcriptional activator of pobA